MGRLERLPPSSLEEDGGIGVADTALLEKWKAEVGEIPKATCPDIDKCIKEIDSAMSLLKDLQKLRPCDGENCDVADDAEDYASDAYYNLLGIEDELEKLRKDNQQLRELGEFWYKKCKELLSEEV